MTTPLPDKIENGGVRLFTRKANTDRFKRVAEKRINRVLHEFKLIGNMGNKSMYYYTPKQVKQIFDKLEGELRVSKSFFKVKKEKEFKL